MQLNYFGKNASLNFFYSPQRHKEHSDFLNDSVNICFFHLDINPQLETKPSFHQHHDLTRCNKVLTSILFQIQRF